MSTECVDPTELKAGDLQAFVEGRAEDVVRAHIARCPHCAARVATYQRMTDVLHVALHRVSCPPSEHLALYQMRLLTAHEQLVIARHVRTCPHCQRELEMLAGETTAPSLLTRLRRSAEAIQAVLAPPLAAASGLRGGAPIQRFQTEALEIHISVMEGHRRGRRTVMGRLHPRDERHPPVAGTEVWLLRGEQAWAAPVEADGAFTFEDVEPGTYDLGVECGGEAIIAEGIQVQ
jgi:hypothetical protein